MECFLGVNECKKGTNILILGAMKMKILLILLLVSFTSFTANHKFYVSVTEIKYNPKAQDLEIISRVFINDFEALLQKRYDKSVRLDGPKETDKADEYIKKYLGEKMQIWLDGKSYSVKYLGKEYENDMAVLYLEVPNVKPFNSIKVRNTVLTDMFSEQKNLVHVEYKGDIKSLILTRSNQEESINFEE